MSHPEPKKPNPLHRTRRTVNPWRLPLILFLGMALLIVVPAPSPVAAPPGSPPDEKQLLLSPAALKDAQQEQSLEPIRRNFQDPPAEFRTAPLWVWNDEMNPERIKEQLRQFKEQGMGGVFVHPRPGLITEYLGKEWFEFWRLAADESKRLGIFCNIYDENSYPSGFAGGHVPAVAPDTASQYVQAEIADKAPGRAGPELLGAFRVKLGENGQVVEAARVEPRPGEKTTGKFAVFSLRHAGGSPWTGQFPYVDLTNPETARQFIATTFEPYKKHFGDEFGKTIKWTFDDEPLLATGGAYEEDSLSLPLSYITLAEFQKRNGYDLREVLPSLFWDVGDWRRVRFDYWQTLHDLWKENFFRPIFEWCDRNNLRFTGHFMEHEWPYPWISPDDASLYAYQHVPGIDMLEGVKLREKGVDAHMLFTIRQVASVSHQLGRRAFSETYGVAGWDSTLEHYKRMGDWQLVNGINFIDQHLAYTTVRGARKRDHPQSFSDISAWWPYYRLHADHTARLSYVLSQGVAQNRVLVLQPTTSGFVLARRGGETPELAKLRDTNSQLNQYLADHQIDFDLGDEYMMEWFGEARDGKLAIARASYDLVVWPQGMINVRKETVPLLKKYLENGGEILALGEPAAFVDGKASPALQNLRAQNSARWHTVGDLAGLVAEIQRRLPPRVTFDKELPQGIGHRMWTIADGSVFHLFTNATSQSVTARATIEGAGLEEWNSTSGKIAPFATRSAAPGKIDFDLNLPPVGSRLFAVSRQAPGAPAAVATARSLQLTLADWKVTPAGPNVLPLDYCDLLLAGKTYGNINTWSANWKIWQMNGFERPAWDNAIQFKRRIVDLPPFPANSGFEATFHFTVASPEAIQGAHLALETPELYKITVNGHPMDFSRADRWVDPHLKRIPVESLLKVGENTVKLVGEPFHVLMELENIYILGNFTVRATERGFAMHPPSPLATGSWAKQGYPFYSGSMLYETRVDVPKRSRSLRVSFPAWQGSVAELLLDGKHVETLGWQPYVCEIPAVPGAHTVALRVVATPRNLFGPFHNPTKPRMRSWPAAWSEFPEHQPAGSQYDFVDYGLMEAFQVEALR